MVALVAFTFTGRLNVGLREQDSMRMCNERMYERKREKRWFGELKKESK